MQPLTSSEALVPFPLIPIEILRDITELACSSRSTAISLTLVSSFIRLWAIPVLYHVVLLRSTSAVKHFAHALRSSPHFNTALCQQVKHLGIMALGPTNAIREIITNCTNLQSLACGHLGTLMHPPISQSEDLSMLHERHLLGLSCRDGIPFKRLSPLVTSLHLQIPTWQTLPTLLKLQDHLPRVSHLALSLPSAILSSRSIHILLGDVLERNQRLDVVLVQTTDLSEEEFEAFKNDWYSKSSQLLDDRVVLRRISRSLVAQWEELSASPAGLWGEAEQDLKNRRRLKVDEFKRFREISFRDIIRG